MAAKQHGTAYLHGVDIDYFTSAAVISISKRSSDALVNEVHNKSGQLTSLRTDDQRDEVEATMRIESGSARLVIGALCTLATSDFAGAYRVVSTNETKQVKENVEYQVSLVKEEYMTYS